MRRRATAMGAMVLAISLVVGVATAGAASPREIYQDWADNGRLDGTYSRAELEAALSDTTIQGYGDDNFGPALTDALAQQGQQSGGVAAGSAGLGETQEVDTLPFTGADVALVVGVAIVLLLLGFGLRRVGRSKA